MDSTSSQTSSKDATSSPVISDRLTACGWSSIDAGTFARDPSRLERDVSEGVLNVLHDYCRGSRVLELCCGTGVLAEKLAEAGYSVMGLDLSADMLGVGEERLRQRNQPAISSRLRLRQADICTFDLGEQFDFILLEDDSFVYLHTHQDQLACLSRVREHLAESGLFLLIFTTPQRELLADEDYEYDEVRQVKTIPCRWSTTDAAGEAHVVEKGFQRRRLTWPCELELLLETSGLEPIERWGDLERTPFKEPAYQEYCYLIRKADAGSAGNR